MILFISRMAPSFTGSGGSQRAMHLLQAVARHGPVDFLMLHRGDDIEPATESLEALRPLVRTCQRLQIDEWAPSWARPSALPWRVRQVREALTIRCTEAPQFSARKMNAIGDLLPQHKYDLTFACRLSSAWIADGLIAHGVLKSSAKLAELDDMLSIFRRRQFALTESPKDRLSYFLQQLEIRRIEKAETSIARSWDGVSLASAEDAAELSVRAGKLVHFIPNVVERPALAASNGTGDSILFVGHLSYGPNTLGLTRFLTEIWPQIRAKIPTAQLNIVGVCPEPTLIALATMQGAHVHANVPSVEPFYQACDLVIAPIWDGGGTRIKIIEAMAYGRPVVSTTIGAEGLQIYPDIHALIADESNDFAEAVVRLARDAKLRHTLTKEASRLQQERFTPESLNNAVAKMIDQATEV